MSVRRRVFAWCAPLGFLLAMGCGAPEDAPASGAAPGLSTPPGLDPAVVAAKAVRANPEAADSILSALGLSRADFDALMYDVAADADRARAYAQAMR